MDFVHFYLETSVTGTSINPARSLGPMLVTGSFDTTHLVFWVGPLLGGWVGGMVYSNLLRNNRYSIFVRRCSYDLTIITCSSGSPVSQEEEDV